MTLTRSTALTPPEHDVAITTEYVQDIDWDEDADLVGITSATCQAPRADQVAGAVARGLASTAPCLVEVKTSLGAILPAGVGSEAGVDLLRRGD